MRQGSRDQIAPCSRKACRDFYLIDSLNVAYMKQQSEDTCVLYKNSFFVLFTEVKVRAHKGSLSIEQKSRCLGKITAQSLVLTL